MTSLADHLTRHRTTLAVAGALLMVAGAWMGATAYAAPVAERETREHSSWSASSAYAYSVPVTRNSTHWPVGTVLPMGQPAYFRTISDTILLEHDWTPRLAPDAHGIAASRMVVRIVGEDLEGRSFWTIEYPLGETSAADLNAGLHVAGEIDLDDLINQVTALGLELPLGEGRINWSVRTTVVWAFESGGRHEQGQSEDVLPILANDPRFVLPAADELRWDRPHAQTESLVTSHPAGMPGFLRSLRSLGALTAGAMLLGAAILSQRLSKDSEGFEKEYRRHREWISITREVPETAVGASLVEVSSLEDLVHVAADARTRVLLDASTREFFALLPGVTYRYGRHAFGP